MGASGTLGRVLDEKGRTVVERLDVAASHFDKFKGWMMNRSLQKGDGLLIPNCRAIHCCFMLLPIDVLFLSKQGEIVHVVSRMKPWTFSKVVFDGDSVLECYPGTVDEHGLSVGSRLTISL